MAYENVLFDPRTEANIGTFTWMFGEEKAKEIFANRPYFLLNQRTKQGWYVKVTRSPYKNTMYFERLDR